MYIKNMSRLIYKFLEWINIVPKPSDPHEKLSSVLPKLKTGDLVFACSKRTAAGYTIRYFGKCPYSHVGIIIMIDNKPYLFHATHGMYYRYEDPFTHKYYNSGVMLADFEDAVKQETSNDYLYAYKSLSAPLSKHAENLLLHYMKSAKGKAYQLLLTDAMSALTSKDLSGHDSNYFCSELVASAFNYAGIIDTNYYQETFLPRDFLYQQISPRIHWKYFYDAAKIIDK